MKNGHERLSWFIEKYFDDIADNQIKNKIGLDLLSDVVRFHWKRGDLNYLLDADNSMLGEFFSQMIRNLNGYESSPVYLLGVSFYSSINSVHEYLMELSIYVGAIYNLDYRKHNAVVSAPEDFFELSSKEDVKRFYSYLRDYLIHSWKPSQDLTLTFATINKGDDMKTIIATTDYFHMLLSEKHVLCELYKNSTNSFGKLAFDEDLNVAYYRKLVKKDGNQYYSSKNVPFFVTSLIDIFLEIKKVSLLYARAPLSITLESVVDGETYVMGFNDRGASSGVEFLRYCTAFLTTYCDVALNERGKIDYIKIDIRNINTNGKV